MKKIVSFLLSIYLILSLSVQSFGQTLKHNEYFCEILGLTDKQDIAFGTIVYKDGRCADISDEDLKAFIDVYWNFTYDRVIAPTDTYEYGDYYIKLWNSDKSKSYTIYANSGVIVGSFGAPHQSHGELKQNFIWYLPYVGNARNALYSANEKLFRNYREATREVTEADMPFIPADNLLDTTTASDWAKPEIQNAGACNLMVYDLSGKYTQSITRLDFCLLAYRLIATEFTPESDSRIGIWSAIDKVIDERGLREAYQSASFTDCENEEIKFLAATGIIEGMGDGTFAPDSNLTREMAATILYRMAKFLGNKEIPALTQSSYYDVDKISDWAVDSVQTMHLMGIMNGVGDGYFSPQGTYTVEQAIATMLRLYECY